MNLNITNIKDQLYTSGLFAIGQVGQLVHHSVRILKETVDYVRQDARLAGLTFAIANIAFIDIAFKVAEYVNRNYLPHEGLTGEAVFGYLGTLFSAVVVLNAALYLVLKPSLSPLQITVISLASWPGYFIYVFCKLMYKR
jgi:hypothetical protein